MASWLEEAVPEGAGAPQASAHWLTEATPVAAALEEPGKGEALLRGGAQGATLGFGDELQGFIQATGDKVRGDNGGFWDHYAHERDAARRENEAAQQAHSRLYGAGQIAGGILPSLVPGLNAGRGATLGASVGNGLALGMAGGLGSSNADLTKGQVGQAAIDTGVGGTVGALLGGAGAGVGLLAKRAFSGLRLANADAAELANKAAQKSFRSARSSLGGETTAVLRDFSDMQQIAANAGGVHPPEVVAAAQAKLADPKYLDVVRNAGRNAVAVGADRLSGSLESARNVFESAKTGITPEAIEAKAAESMANPIRTQLVPRLKTYATRAIPIAIGATMGGPMGAAAGGATAAALGAPGTALANLAKNPGMRAALWRAAGGGAGALQSTAQRGEGPTSLELSPRIAAMIAALRKSPESPTWAQSDQEQQP